MNCCSLASVSRAVDRVASGSESIVVSAGYLLVEINQLHLAVDELCRVEDTRVMLEECERRSDETWGSCNRPGQSHDVARAGQREGLGAFWSSGVRPSIIATDARRAFTSKSTIVPGTQLKSRMRRDPFPSSPE
jgi:hypothetical protein